MTQETTKDSSSVDELLDYLDTRLSDIEFLLAGMPQKSSSLFNFKPTTNAASLSLSAKELESIAAEAGISGNVGSLQHSKNVETETDNVIKGHDSLRELVQALDTLDLWKFINLDYESNDKQENEKEGLKQVSLETEDEKASLLARQEQVLASAPSFKNVEQLASSSFFQTHISVSSTKNVTPATFLQLKTPSLTNSTISISPKTVEPLCHPKVRASLESHADTLDTLVSEIDVLSAQSALLLDRLAAVIIQENEIVADASGQLTNMGNKIRIRDRAAIAQNTIETRWKKRAPRTETDSSDTQESLA